MKNIFTLMAVAIVFAACKEVPPAINFEESKQLRDTTYVVATVPAAQNKNVLIEDVSGVQCVNCPDAAVIAKDIMDANQHRVFAAVLHTDLAALKNFVEPIDKEGYKSKYDFRTADATNILQIAGIPGSLPRGFINRRFFAGKSERVLGRQDWATKTNEELAIPTPVNIELTNEFNQATKEGVISVKLTYTQAVTKKQYISIALIEDSIIDVQEYEDKQTFEVKFNPNYVHMHVLRDIITFATGDAIATDQTLAIGAGRVFEKQYAYKMDISSLIKVNPKNAKLLVFVHEDVPDLNILHVQEIDVIE